MYFTYITNPSISTLELVYVRNRKFGTRNARRSCVAAVGCGMDGVGGGKCWQFLVLATHAICTYRKFTILATTAAWLYTRWPGHGTMGPYEYIFYAFLFTHYVHHILSCVCSLFMFGVCVYVILSPKLYSQKIMVWGRWSFSFSPTCREFSLSSYALSCSIHVYTYKIRIYSFSCPLCPTDRLLKWREPAAVATSDIR